MMSKIKRPAPPPGYVPFQWRYRQVDKYTNAPLCPNCDAPAKAGDRWGYVWEVTAFTDPAAQAVFDQARNAGWVPNGALDPAYTCDGQPVLAHWSRYCTGYCIVCGVRFWHDFVGWQYYYLPLKGQLSLF